jgi:hypothetical protein
MKPTRNIDILSVLDNSLPSSTPAKYGIKVIRHVIFLPRIQMEIERSSEPLTKNDLEELYLGSMQRLKEYFVFGQGSRWLSRLALFLFVRPQVFVFFN